jgi:hypothetical protein
MSEGRPRQTRADGLHELLPWYVNGTLEATEVAAFRRHLDGCEMCRDEMEFLERLQAELGRHGEAFLEDHPAAQQLVAYARDELGDDESRAVRHHLALCATCTTEMRWITGTAVADTPAAARAPRALRWKVWLPWAAAVAAGLAGFLIAASLRDPGMGPGPLRGGAPPVTVLVGNVRDVAEPNLVEVADGNAMFLLAAAVDAEASAFPGQFTIVDTTGRTVRRGMVAADAYTQGFVFIDCGRADFPDGSYRLRIDAADVPPFFFDFRVVSRTPTE